MVGSKPYGIFINTKNTIHVANRENGKVMVWNNDSNTLISRILSGVNMTYSVFGTTNVIFMPTVVLFIEESTNGSRTRLTLRR